MSMRSSLVNRAKLRASLTPLLPLARELKLRFSSRRGAAYDREAREVMRRVLRFDSIALDIGANFGSVLRDLVKMAPGGRHHAFEPLPDLAAGLRRRFSNVTIHEVALSNRTGTTSFVYVRGDPGLSGIHPVHHAAGRLERETIEVRTERLDNAIDANTKVDLVKMDVEGAEFWVFDGGRELLTRDQPVVLFESSGQAANLYEGSTPEAIHRLLADCGLKVSLMARWLAGQPALSEAEFGHQIRTHSSFYFIAYP
jgi:FkbM family methyltransferase